MNDLGSNLERSIIEVLKETLATLAEGVSKDPRLATIAIGWSLFVLLAISILLLSVFWKNVSAGDRVAFAGFALMLLAGLIAIGYSRIDIIRPHGFSKKFYKEEFMKPKMVEQGSWWEKLSHLDDQQKRPLRTILEGITRHASSSLSLPQEIVRSNIFVPHTDGKMRIVSNLHHNMLNPEELTLEIPIGYGCTGQAFQREEQTIAIFDEGWGDKALDDEQIRKVHKQLYWILSTPITISDDKIGIVNVDGLRQRLSEEYIANNFGLDMIYWSGLLSHMINAQVGG